MVDGGGYEWGAFFTRHPREETPIRPKRGESEREKRTENFNAPKKRDKKRPPAPTTSANTNEKRERKEEKEKRESKGNNNDKKTSTTRSGMKRATTNRQTDRQTGTHLS